LDKYHKQIRAALWSALGYGLGFVAGVVTIQLILDIGFLETISQEFENQHLWLGLFILFTVVLLGGGLAGAIGGFFLSRVVKTVSKKRLIIRSAFGTGVGFILVLLPVMMLLAILAMYNVDGTSPIAFLFFMGLVGVSFGLVSGYSIGTLPTKFNYWRVTRGLMLAFGIGGLAFGFGLWNYFYVLYESGAAYPELLLSFLFFGGTGGFVLGWIFSLDQESDRLEDGDQGLTRANVIYRVSQWFKGTMFYRKRGFWGTVIIVALVILLSRIIALSPLNFTSANISDFLPSKTNGVYWSDPSILVNSQTAIGPPDISQRDALTAATWEQNGEVFLRTADASNQMKPVWQSVINLSQSPERDSWSPQIEIDGDGRVHIVWVEGSSESGDISTIYYRSCLDEQCTDELEVTADLSPDCSYQTNVAPTIAINDTDILVVWGVNSSQIPYATWPVGALPSTATYGCFQIDASGMVTNPRLFADSGEGFILLVEGDPDIFVTAANPKDGTLSVMSKLTGHSPNALVDHLGQVHFVWCGADGSVQYQKGVAAQPEEVSGANCLTRPELAQDADGVIHLLWYDDQVRQNLGKTIKGDLIFESRKDSNSWATPVIMGRSAKNARPDVAVGTDGVLHMVWNEDTDDSSQMNYASYRVYSCTEENLNMQGKLALEIAQSGVYRPAEDIVPYCDNQFDRLLYLPRPNQAYSDIPPTTNGAFDQVADLIRSAKYEVLLSTMWYESNETGNSPGDVIARAIKDLYDQVKANPERYPRGMTVRILLGNPPELTLSSLVSQVWDVFRHLRNAGVPTLTDPDIGWNLEIANYQGSWPHAHTKIVVIDGKTAVAAGFNFQHKHLSKNHPSGMGDEDFDLGIQMTGPVAQSTQLAFDDLWNGSNRIDCPDLDSDSPLWWLSCRRASTSTEHIPEVQRYYLAEADHNAFALHRTLKFDESDVVVSSIVASAQETLDVLQVNFTLKLICDLNVLFRICNFNDAPEYMTALMDAIETNHVKTRVLVKKKPIEAIENNIAVQEFRQALAKRGLSDLVEFRYFNDSVHAKAVLIDKHFLLIGSQNFHYSAFGKGIGLTEFNIGTDDPQAITDFRRTFEYFWERGTLIPIE